MRVSKGWIVVVAVAALVVAGFSGTALAHSPTAPADGGEADGWEEMHAGCHGSEDGGVHYDQVTLSRIAGVLGLTPEELSTRLSAGETVAEVAQAQGVALEAVVEALIAPYRDQLQVAVIYGYLTQEQADELLHQRVEWLGASLTGATATGGSYEPYHGGMMSGWQNGGMMGGYGSGMGWGGGMMGSW